MVQKTTFLLTIMSLCAFRANADEQHGFDAMDTYVSNFFSRVGLDLQAGSSDATNVTTWHMPESINYRGEGWRVTAGDGTVQESGRLKFQVSSPDNATNLVVHAEFFPSGKLGEALASAINIPCNLPASILASAFSFDQTADDVFLLNGPRPAFAGNYCYVATGNCVLTFSRQSVEKDFALSLLRAGGVEIPENGEESSANSASDLETKDDHLPADFSGEPCDFPSTSTVLPDSILSGPADSPRSFPGSTQEQP